MTTAPPEPYVVPRGTTTGTLLDAAMTDRRTSLRELQAATEVPRATLSNLANAKGSTTLTRALRIAKALEHPVGGLFEYADADRPTLLGGGR